MDRSSRPRRHLRRFNHAHGPRRTDCCRIRSRRAVAVQREPEQHRAPGRPTAHPIRSRPGARCPTSLQPDCGQRQSVGLYLCGRSPERNGRDCQRIGSAVAAHGMLLAAIVGPLRFESVDFRSAQVPAAVDGPPHCLIDLTADRRQGASQIAKWRSRHPWVTTAMPGRCWREVRMSMVDEGYPGTSGRLSHGAIPGTFQSKALLAISVPRCARQRHQQRGQTFQDVPREFPCRSTVMRSNCLDVVARKLSACVNDGLTPSALKILRCSALMPVRQSSRGIREGRQHRGQPRCSAGGANPRDHRRFPKRPRLLWMWSSAIFIDGGRRDAPLSPGRAHRARANVPSAMVSPCAGDPHTLLHAGDGNAGCRANARLKMDSLSRRALFWSPRRPDNDIILECAGQTETRKARKWFPPTSLETPLQPRSFRAISVISAVVSQAQSGWPPTPPRFLHEGRTAGGDEIRPE